MGSTTLITTEYGEKVKTLSYDAFIRLLPETPPFRAGVKNRSWRFFGKPRNEIDWQPEPQLDFTNNHGQSSYEGRKTSHVAKF